MMKGSCACGSVTFQITGEPDNLSYCHCSRCRKTAGVFAPFLEGSIDDFKLLSGAENIKRFQPNPDMKYVRCFCENCGSALWVEAESKGIYDIVATTLDTDLVTRPMAHIYAASKPNWHDITDNIPIYAEHYRNETKD
jgi:hypothetical protein